MKPPPIRQPAAPTKPTDAKARLWRSGVDTEETAAVGRSGTFEPLLAGDRQKQKHVAKAHDPLQSGACEVSLS
jgi:hypothetical protein